MQGMRPGDSLHDHLSGTGWQRLLRVFCVWLCCITFLSSAILMAQRVQYAESPSIATIQKVFQTPPDDCRIMMRWWWFGTAVDKPELSREIQEMKAGGIGGFEIQPVYPLALNDPVHGIKNLPYLSAGFLDVLHFAAEKGRAEGMRVDLTLTSGWPYGGAYLPVTLAAGMLKTVRVKLNNQQGYVAVPSLEAGEKLLAAFRVHGDPSDFRGNMPTRLPLNVQNGRLQVSGNIFPNDAVLFFISSRTGQMVKRPAVGASGFVLDHYDRAAIEDHLQTVGDPLLRAFGPHPPYAVFSDSLEVFGSDWTPNILEQFRQRRGYDLTPYLPALVGNIGPKTLAIRHDWGKTLTELVEENYLVPIHTWAQEHGTHFRAQNYGTPPVTLSSYSLVDFPEGENPRWREFSETRWASSASHLYGKNVTSAETWTWLHSPAFRATPLDMKAEADLDFLNGINQIIGHGWPYSPPFAGEPGWYFYAAGAWNNHNPWWFAMPKIALYLQRISYVLRQGKPDNDIAIFLPDDDAWANFTTTRVSLNEQMKSLLGPTLIPQILDAGFNFDYIDSGAIAKAGIPYRVLILPCVTRIPLSTYQAILKYQQQGGIVIATRRLPSKAPGLMYAAADGSKIQTISDQLFRSGLKNARYIPDENYLAMYLARTLQPDVIASPQTHDIGFVHRKLPTADIYFVANTSNRTRNFQATFRVHDLSAVYWNPDSGKATFAGNGNVLNISMAPYESRVVVFSHSLARTSQHAVALEPMPGKIHIDQSWSVKFPTIKRRFEYSQLHTWTTDPATTFYSGLAIYQKTIHVSGAMLRSDNAIYLEFGKGVPLTPQPTHGPGTQAWLDSPIREAAQIFVNGKSAGILWHPPYRLEVTPMLHAGQNQLRIVVGNLAINEMARRAMPDYRLLNLRYGKRFQSQDLENLCPLPSGILGPVALVPYLKVPNSGRAAK